ncbi:MAG: threonine/serine dehydratase [Candidatus Heimdallarchaeota archaeon]
MLSEIGAAYSRIKSHINKTPVLTSRTLNRKLDMNVFFKCENFQRVGAFKFRGALNALSQLSLSEKQAGVITHSSGNHAQAVALASRELQINATIVMPENAPKVKKAATEGYGANIVLCGNNPNDRKDKVEELIQEFNYELIHPYNDFRIIHGAGTAAYELLKEVGDLDLIVAPVGGGGLLSGTSIAAKGLNKDIAVLGVEPLNADDAFRSFQDGTRIFPSINPNTIADGLRTSLGDITFDIIKQNVDGIVRVTEEGIINAMRYLWERMKIIIEPSGAVPLAGLFQLKENPEEFDFDDKRVGVILSGGNIDLTDFFNLLRKKLVL